MTTCSKFSPFVFRTTEEFNADEDALTVANATVKLRPKKTGVEDSPSLVHKRASDMISCLSNQLISQFQQNSPNVVITPTQRQVNVSVTSCGRE